MKPPFIHEVTTSQTADSLAHRIHDEPGVVLLRSGLLGSPQARYSFLAARPFLTFRSFGARCEVRSTDGSSVQFGDPWHLLEVLMARYELLHQMDLPFPLGGCFGFWGYELKNFIEPRLARRAINDLELPDCHLGFYSSLVAFDHHLAKTWVVCTGLNTDGSRSEDRARAETDFWLTKLTEQGLGHDLGQAPLVGARRQLSAHRSGLSISEDPCAHTGSGKPGRVVSNLSRNDFLARVHRCQRYIRSGDIYQVNLSHRLAVPYPFSGWDLFQDLAAVSPAPFSAYLNCGEFQIASSSPELFLRLSGSQVQTRPIKGTRPRSSDPTRDAQLTYELQTSSKEMAELVMITDLLRNDLGRVCEFGSVQVPELVRLERYPQVQHLVSTVAGCLRSGETHLSTLAACFPGGSVTGAPKIRAMEIIDELEPNTRGPYTGALGYLGFNRESQLNIIIRTAICRTGLAYFHVGAGIVADSVPVAEYAETLAKARGFFEALRLRQGKHGDLAEFSMNGGEVAPFF